MHPVHLVPCGVLTGVMSYLSAPLWFMFLALSTATGRARPDRNTSCSRVIIRYGPVASGTGYRAVCFDHGTAVPAKTADIILVVQGPKVAAFA